jgi:stage V sporulation protein S
MDEVTIVRVRGESRPADVAGALAGIYRDHGQVAAQAIGAAAVNQMVKAVAVAISYLANDGKDMACIPSFVDVTNADQSVVTAMRMELVERDGHGKAVHSDDGPVDLAEEGGEFIRISKDGDQGA